MQPGLENALDIKSKEKRSQNMAAIRSKNTKPEVYLRKLLFRRGYRYSLHSKNIPGKPDLYLRKYNTAVFVHGCFWHRHEGCKFAYTPKSNVDFWEKKFAANQKRDLAVREQLKDSGVRMLIVWECTVKKMVKDPGYRDEVLNRIEDFLHSSQDFLGL